MVRGQSCRQVSVYADEMETSSTMCGFKLLGAYGYELFYLSLKIINHNAIFKWSYKTETYSQLAPFDLTKKNKKTFVVQDAIKDSAESHGRHLICCVIVQEDFIGYIAEHPNDEEEVEGIDLHQQRYPGEGSDMD
ncbi:hypothetical protein F2Q70_00028166 [Brassica cretica]|uniref:Uncharacterized protein n=1 Tax=Brassica cretica TaxID=69181 RepID=A0A8S9LB61_BRACR|nr:hypothetical protein F2Q70_00028166 [Brassica cretica]KAF3575655.1 hypothetical protein DY000_02034869 [Brassica cretica]